LARIRFANDDETGPGAGPAPEPPPLPGRAPGRARRWARSLAVLGAVAFLAGACGDESGDYFPLAPGWTWSYRVTTEIKSVGRDTARAFWFSLPPRRVGEEKVTPKVMHDGRVYYYAKREDGIHRIGYRVRGEDVFGPRVDAYVLKYPLEEGTAWRMASRTYLLKKQIISPRDVSVHDIRTSVDLDYTIEKLDDTVAVPAGTFRNCVKVRGTGTTTFELGERFGIIHIQVETLEWYAPGVGLVKMVRRETSRPANPVAGEIVMELEFVDRGSWLE